MSDFFEDDEADQDTGESVFANEAEITPVPYFCAACGELNETPLDLSTGDYGQVYTEDCAVCCRPNLLRISVDPDTLLVTIATELEYDS